MRAEVGSEVLCPAKKRYLSSAKAAVRREGLYRARRAPRIGEASEQQSEALYPVLLVTLNGEKAQVLTLVLWSASHE